MKLCLRDVHSVQSGEAVEQIRLLVDHGSAKTANVGLSWFRLAFPAGEWVDYKNSST